MTTRATRRWTAAQGDERCTADRKPLKDGSGAQCMLPRAPGSMLCHIHQTHRHAGEVDMYVIKRMPDGAYVAPSGRSSSYTQALQDAQTFSTVEAAEKERCPGNEVIVSVDSQLSGGR